MLAKQHDKRKKSFAKEKKARAHSAHVRVNFDDVSTMPDLSPGSVDDNDSFSSGSAASSDAASSHGRKMSKKSRARANAALYNRGRAHSNSATAVTSSRSSASAAAIHSASALGSSKKLGNHLIFDSEDDSATEISVVRKKHKKQKKYYASSHGYSIWVLCLEITIMMAIVLATSNCTRRRYAAFYHSRATIFAAKVKATYQPCRDPQSSSSSRSAQSYSVHFFWLDKPSQQLCHLIPEWFLLCDSGATLDMFNHCMFLANIRDTYLQASWGIPSSWSLGLGFYNALLCLQWN